jgi:hypothetical protein
VTGHLFFFYQESLTYLIRLICFVYIYILPQIWSRTQSVEHVLSLPLYTFFFFFLPLSDDLTSSPLPSYFLPSLLAIKMHTPSVPREKHRQAKPRNRDIKSSWLVFFFFFFSFLLRQMFFLSFFLPSSLFPTYLVSHGCRFWEQGCDYICMYVCMCIYICLCLCVMFSLSLYFLVSVFTVKKLLICVVLLACLLGEMRKRNTEI